jgi:hypothetical protein
MQQGHKGVAINVTTLKQPAIKVTFTGSQHAIQSFA